jgi:hypothetical protein
VFDPRHYLLIIRGVTAFSTEINAPDFGIWLERHAAGTALLPGIEDLVAPSKPAPAAAAPNPAPKTTAAEAETACRDWLASMMEAGRPAKTKEGYRIEAQRTYGVSQRGFLRAWSSATAATGKKMRPGAGPAVNHDGVLIQPRYVRGPSAHFCRRLAPPRPRMSTPSSADDPSGRAAANENHGTCGGGEPSGRELWSAPSAFGCL